MKVGHILFKVQQLATAVKGFQKKGFRVEYGSRKHPHNALIYFSQGPYIELLEKAPVSALELWALKRVGHRPVSERFHLWEKAPERFFEMCLETRGPDFRQAKEILNRYGLNYFQTRSKRIDPFHRRLRWKLLFPHPHQLPFMMTPFNSNPKPQNFVHPNGVQQIKKVFYPGAPKSMKILRELCDDKILLLEKEGDNIRLEYS